MLNHLLNEMRKRLPGRSQDIFPGIPTNIAVGPVSHKAESSIGPKGGEAVLIRTEIDWLGLTVTLDGTGGGGSRVVFQDGMDVDREFPASVAWTTGYRSNRTG